ncbi:hypothetical protein SAMN04488061_3110 [Filomicrobium insigne]|uniref:MxaH protein n=1 Tax=Filomicrobium insigne TaxID=418854 RepID=A0A1H0T0C7_9HYPH|nr:hypothetical protein [Filomicrobium insigne]SDP47424.1 hypothetical protein SAMN04488061_3110 [Filomicrobium insigne]
MRHNATHFGHRHRPAVKRVMAVACILTSAALGACSDDPAETIAQHPAAQEAPEKPLTQDHWLEANEGTKPEVWLASRIDGQNATPGSPAVERIASLLNTAAGQFRESPRMIANRAVQLEGMLAEIGAPEPAIEIIEELSRIVGENTHDEGFGSLCQHYFNLRTANHNRDQALADLKSRYGAQQ